jgi:predicted dehydrogenase
MNRLHFLQNSLAATTGFTLGGKALFADASTTAPATAPASAAAAAPKRKIKIGLIGCGSRSNWVTTRFVEHGGYEIHAVADYFPDRALGAARRWRVPTERTFSGINAYKRVLESKPDAVAIIATPWFHPQIAADAIAAGIHVYQAKPVAVDVPGSLSIEKTGQLATAKKLVMLVDFQTRATPFYIEALRRVNAGLLGERVLGEGYYHCDGMGYRGRSKIPAEDRLRNWSLYRNLSGEIIVEQNIHTIDVMSWAFNDTPPLSAYGTAAQKVRRIGDCNDHYALHFQYPNNTAVTFASHQHRDHGSLPEGIVFRLFGSKGVLETKYGGNVMIRGDKNVFYRGGRTTNLYSTGAVANVAGFYTAVTTGDYRNTTVPISVRSNLVCILGRTAAEAQASRIVKWEEILRDQTRFEFDTTGLKG